MINNRVFRPTLFTTMLALVGLFLLVSLGNWQMDRAEFKQRLELKYQRQGSAPVVRLSRLQDQGMTGEDIEWRRVRIAGRFDSEHTYLLDNRVLNGQAGYHVYTLFLPNDGENPLLVNRGWLAAGLLRDRLPGIQTPGETQELLAQIIYPAAPDNDLGAYDEKFPDGLNRVQAININRISDELGYTLQPFVIRLIERTEPAFLLDWEEPGFDRQRHLGYAFQWYALAVCLAVIYLVSGFKRK